MQHHSLKEGVYACPTSAFEDGYSQEGSASAQRHKAPSWGQAYVPTHSAAVRHCPDPALGEAQTGKSPVSPP